MNKASLESWQGRPTKGPSLRIGRNIEKKSVDAVVLQTTDRTARWGAFQGPPTSSGPRGSGPTGAGRGRR
eukprot:4120007-Pyramimonas_sp.AAC.1